MGKTQKWEVEKPNCFWLRHRIWEAVAITEICKDRPSGNSAKEYIDVIGNVKDESIRYANRLE